MRILLASEFYYPSVGGVQEVMRQLGERFAENGHDVVVATTHLPERASSSIAGVEVKGFRISGNLVRGMHGEVERYREFVLRQEYDVLLIKAAQQWTFDALTPILDSIKKPKIFIPCGFSGMFDPIYADYFQKMPGWLKKFDRLIFYASDYRDTNLARKHGLTNIDILPNGADEREFYVERDEAFRTRFGIPESAFVVLTVGSLTGSKGHVELAEAFAKCNFGQRPACLLLVGNPPRALKFRQGWFTKIDDVRMMYESGGLVRVAKAVLRPLLERLGLDWVFRALGYPPKTQREEARLAAIITGINATEGRSALLVDLPRPDVVQAFLNSDLFVLASKIEYSPLVLFEATAAGLPFITVPVGNAAEIADWTGAGVICNAKVDHMGYTQVDPAELARQIEKLAADPEMSARLGARGRAAWEERFSWSTIYRSYEKIIEDCLERVTP